MDGRGRGRGWEGDRGRRGGDTQYVCAYSFTGSHGSWISQCSKNTQPLCTHTNQDYVKTSSNTISHKFLFVYGLERFWRHSRGILGTSWEGSAGCSLNEEEELTHTRAPSVCQDYTQHNLSRVYALHTQTTAWGTLWLYIRGADQQLFARHEVVLKAQNKFIME